MATEIHTGAAVDHEELRGLIADRSLEHEFRNLRAQGVLEDKLGDSYCAPELVMVARVDGAPAGFALTFVLPGEGGHWAMTRIGVRAPYRRRGLGSSLLAAAARGLDERGIEERVMGAWEPCPEAAAFAARHGYARVRTFWEMMHRGPVADPTLPDGITLTGWDGSEPALAAWNDAYNDSFARHWHFVRGSLEHARELTRASHFHPDGLLLAWRRERCVGFCRCALFADGRGEIAVLGTTLDARGIGLGRALLRAGARWLVSRGVERPHLMVDGENEGALELYRQEGFAIERTRQLWSRRG